MEHLDVAHRFQTSILAEARRNGNLLTGYMAFGETKKMIGAVDPVILLSIVPMGIGKNNLLTTDIDKRQSGSYVIAGSMKWRIVNQDSVNS